MERMACTRVCATVEWEYYRNQARRARRLAQMVHQEDVREKLLKLAEELDEIADGLEAGSAEVHYPELMPKRGRAA